jgi:hypothetical protein
MEISPNFRSHVINLRETFLFPQENKRHKGARTEEEEARREGSKTIKFSAFFQCNFPNGRGQVEGACRGEEKASGSKPSKHDARAKSRKHREERKSLTETGCGARANVALFWVPRFDLLLDACTANTLRHNASAPSSAFSGERNLFNYEANNGNFFRQLFRRVTKARLRFLLHKKAEMSRAELKSFFSPDPVTRLDTASSS